MLDESYTVAVLGGYGRLGRAVGRLLLSASKCRVRLVGRDESKARQAAAELDAGDRVEIRRAEAGDGAALSSALAGAALLLVCTTGSAHTESLARLVGSLGVDCVDARYPCAVQDRWRSCDAALRLSGCRVLIHAGHLPGLPGLLLRHILARHPEVRAMALSTLVHPRPPVSLGAAVELLAELRESVFARYRDGQWRTCGLWRGRRVDFGGPWGRRLCLPVLPDELRRVPPGVERLELLVAGVGGLAGSLAVFLRVALGGRLGESGDRFAARLLRWGMNRPSRRPEGAVFQAEAFDEAGRRRFRLRASHEESYAMAAASLVACVEEYARGCWPLAGVHSVSTTADPARMLRAMAALGTSVEERWEEA